MATVVLVHGTWSGGWVWRDVTPQLEAAGHVVHALTLTGLGERKHLLTRAVGLDTHIEDVVNALVYRDLTDVVLVGHSYGGMVITGAADRVTERIAHLVYLDALVPQDGESLVDLGPADGWAKTARQIRETGDGWLIPVGEKFRDADGKRQPHPLRTWTDKLALRGPIAEHVQKTYVLLTAEKGPDRLQMGGMTKSWARAQGSDWQRLEVDTIHRIETDPQPKVDALQKILAGVSSAS